MGKKTIVEVIFFIILLPVVASAKTLIFDKDASVLIDLVGTFSIVYVIWRIYKGNRQSSSKLKKNYKVEVQDATGGSFFGEVVEVEYDLTTKINVVFVRVENGEIYPQREELVKTIK